MLVGAEHTATSFSRPSGTNRHRAREVLVMPSGPELFIVLAIVLIFFGGSQLPKLARNLGQAQKEFKDVLGEAQRDPSPPSTD
jgi:sec-independent protein translocase protein TatA